MNDSKIFAGMLGILVLFALGVVLSQLQSVLLPLVIAVFLSYIFKPLILFLRRKKIPMSLSLLAVLVVVALLLSVCGVVLMASAEAVAKQMPKYVEKFNYMGSGALQALDEFVRRLGVKMDEFKLTDAVEISSVTTFITSGIGSLFIFVGNGVVILLFMLFILAGTGDLTVKVANGFRTDQAERFSRIISNIDEKIRHYTIAKTGISLAVGILSTIVFLIFGLDFPFFWGFLAFILNFIPNAGSIASTILPVILALLQFDSPLNAILILILLLAIHNVMGSVVEPKVFESQLNLSPLLILVALIFWGWLWGVWGMILAVPIMSGIKIVFENIDSLKPVAVLMGGKVKAKS